MQVKNLIEILDRMHPEDEVRVFDHRTEERYEILEVGDVSKIGVDIDIDTRGE